MTIISTAIGILRPRLDPGLVLVLLLTLFTIIPLLSNPGLPDGSDVLIHISRAAEMNRSWSHGLFFPRWAESFYLGYGSPAFHFYASLTYYLTSLLHFAFNLSVLDALRALLLLCFLACSGGMYLFARRRFGYLGGVIAGLVYVYSPYLMFTEPYARCAFPELLAFAIFPWLLWRAEILRERISGLNFLALLFLQVALINAHNLMAALLTGMLLLWILWRALAQGFFQRQGAPSWPAAAWQLLAIGLGIGASASFWLPVILEADSVSLQNLVLAGDLDFRLHFLQLSDLLALPQRNDAGALNGLISARMLGIAQWTLALLGLASAIWLWIHGDRQRIVGPLSDALLMGALALVMCILTLSGALWLWEGFRPLQLLQFPWRLLGPIAACLAILAGCNGLWIERLPRRWQVSLTALVIVFPIGTAIPLFYVPVWRHMELDASVSAFHARELTYGSRGTTSTDEFRPRDVSAPPGATGELLDDYADGYPIDKLNRNVLPSGTTAELLHNSPEAHEWRIQSETDFVAEIYNFYWLGWRAEADGREVEILPSAHHGLISFQVPAGQHRLRLYLGSTPARDLAAWISLLSLLISVAAAIAIWRRQIVPGPSADLGKLSSASRNGILLGGVAVCLCVLILYREGIAWLHSPPGQVLPAQIQQMYTFDENLQLLGYDLNAESLRAGDQLRLRVYWYAREKINVDFSSFLHLSQGGPPLAQLDKQHPAELPVSAWRGPEGYVIDTYNLRLPSSMPPGDYELNVGLYTCESVSAQGCVEQYRPTVSDETGNVIGDFATLTKVRVEAS